MVESFEPTRAGVADMLRKIAAERARLYEHGHDELDGRWALVLRGMADDLEFRGVEREEFQERCSELLQRARRAEESIAGLEGTCGVLRDQYLALWRRANGWRQAARRLRLVLAMIARHGDQGARSLRVASRDVRGAGFRANRGANAVVTQRLDDRLAAIQRGDDR